MQLEPNEEEVSLGKWLQTLFDFDTDISYHIYDYGVRYCSVHIEESNEPYPMFHTNDDSLDWQRGKNSIIVAKFARDNFKSKNITWYCSMKGFYIEIESLIKLKKRYE